MRPNDRRDAAAAAALTGDGRMMVTIMARRRGRRSKPQPVALRLILVALTGFEGLSLGLVNMTSRRWQWFWLIAGAVTMALLVWLTTNDPGAFSKKVFAER
jgi:hypothetical protein